DVIIGMNRIFGTHNPAQKLDRAIGDDLIGVHVRRRTGAGLKNVENKLVVQLAGSNFLRSALDGLGKSGFEQPQISVGLRRGKLNLSERANEVTRKADSTDRKVLDGSLGLGAVQRVLWHLDISHRVFFGPVN